MGWSKPVSSTVKINVDGSVTACDDIASAGGLIRDESGLWLHGFMLNIGSTSVLLAELWAIYHGLLVCWNLGFRTVLLESDSVKALQQVIHFMQTNETGISLVRAIGMLLQREWNCSLSHVHREVRPTLVPIGSPPTLNICL